MVAPIVAAFLGIIGLIIMWVVMGLSLYIASRMTGVSTTFGSAMITSLLAVIAFAVVVGILKLFLPSVIAVLIGFIAALFVIKSRERVGWLHALGIAVLSVIVFAIIVIVLALIFGVGLATAFGLFR